MSVLSEHARDGRRALPELVLAIGVVTVSLTTGLLCVWCGSLIAQDIGSSLLISDTDSSFFAGLLDDLAQWWDSLGPMGQLLVTALGVMLLMTAGASFALAMGAVGVMTWAAAHGHGLASFIHNPAAATSSYLSNVTAGQLAWDLLDFALTFIPGSVLGAGGHAIARTTARDMAANRAAMRQAAAARTEAQHVAESQAAHTRAAQRGKEITSRKRYAAKTVSSDSVNGSDDALSGWSQSRRPSGFQSPNVDEVLRVTDEMGYPRTPHGLDQGVPGRYNGSHAERQKALRATETSLGISKEMCEDCGGWFRSYAYHTQKTWYVTDPNGTWVFKPDGTIITPDGNAIQPSMSLPESYFK